MDTSSRIILLGLLVGVPRIATTQPRQCAVHVDLRELGPNGYQVRGVRCEGVLAREVGGEVIQVVGLTQSVEDFNAHAGTDLHLAWRPILGDSVWLAAVSVRPRLHYQMDTALPTSSTEFRWPVNVLNAEACTVMISRYSAGRPKSWEPRRSA